MTTAKRERRRLRLYDGYPTTSPHLADDVREVQELLNRHGIPVDEDGLFGPRTEHAVEEFQRLADLDTTGIVGCRTWAALLSDEHVPSPDDFVTTIRLDSRAHLRIMEEAEEYRPIIEQCAREIDVPVALVAGIGSRESGWGTSRYMKPRGPSGRGDYGHGHGLMQIDDRSHSDFLRSHDWTDPAENIRYGCTVLSGSIRAISRRTSLVGRGLLRAGTAGYNCGPGNVLRAIRRGRDVDYYTAGRNYSADVFNRAGFFQAHGWR